MQSRIYGPGCARGNQTEALVREIAASGNGGIDVKKVSDLQEMMRLGIMSTPAVAIDGIVRSTGKVPSREEITSWIDGAGSDSAAAPACAGGCCCGGKC